MLVSLFATVDNCFTCHLVGVHYTIRGRRHVAETLAVRSMAAADIWRIFANMSTVWILCALGWTIPRVSMDVRVQAPQIMSHAVSYDMCESHSDCIPPEMCCVGLFQDFCCDIGGTAQRKRRGRLFPNITIPELPVPQIPWPPVPYPVPQPIPIPVE